MKVRTFGNPSKEGQFVVFNQHPTVAAYAWNPIFDDQEFGLVTRNVWSIEVHESQ